jgi:hypothetical protein
MSTRGIVMFAVQCVAQAMAPMSRVLPLCFCAHSPEDWVPHNHNHKAGTGPLKLAQFWFGHNGAVEWSARSVRLGEYLVRLDFGERDQLWHSPSRTSSSRAYFDLRSCGQVRLFVVGECWIPQGAEVKRILTTSRVRNRSGSFLRNRLGEGSSLARVAGVFRLGLLPNFRVTLGIRRLCPAVDPIRVPSGFHHRL